MLLHASTCKDSFFFPWRLSRSAALRVTVSRLQPKIRHTLSVTHHSVRIQHNPQSGGKRMQQARFLQDARCICSLELSSRCSRRLFVTFNIAAIVCDGSNTPLERGEKEWGCRWEGGKNSQWLMASGIKRPHLHHWTIHYFEVDILLCQPVLNEGCRYGIQVLAWKELGQFGTSSKTLMNDRIGNTQYRTG